MKKVSFDIDIDFADRDAALEGLGAISASICENDVLKKHNTGVYFQDIPHDVFTNIATIDHDEAAGLGFFKLDLLNVDFYNQFANEAELVGMMYEPDWAMLEDENIVVTLLHLKKHFNEVKQVKPKSIEQLAMLLAMIRPSKRHLLGKSWEVVENEIWVKPTDGAYHFKKPHAISYAMLIAVQLNHIAKLQKPFG